MPLVEINGEQGPKFNTDLQNFNTSPFCGFVFLDTSVAQ